MAPDVRFGPGNEGKVKYRGSEQFCDKHTRGDKRRRDLVLDLSIKSEAVAIGEIMNLSTRIAREYAGKSHRTFQRDLSILVRLDLIERTPTDVRAKKEIILCVLTLKERKTKPAFHVQRSAFHGGVAASFSPPADSRLADPFLPVADPPTRRTAEPFLPITVS